MSTSLPAFAFIFRSSAKLEPPELAKRNAAARAWALERAADGSLREAAPLEAEGAVVTSEAEIAALPEPAVGAVLVIAAPDLATAVRIAKGHPGLAYGTEIEVRPVKRVVVPGQGARRDQAR